ncbi:MAG: multicopper oxidase domain-containing protein [Bacteroidetes bacterium]|nr:multicopper oxidase domain-containing protein [Bacteroidota bacterium]
MKKSILALFLGSAFLMACGGGEEKKSEETKPAGEQKTEEPAAPAEKQVVELSIEANDQMLFDKKSMEVPAGSHVKLTLKNVGKMPKESMGHNWTLLDQGVDMAKYAIAAVGAKDNDYQPADMYADVIANTRTLGPGEEQTIEFDAPPAGTYQFLCTFPGHYGTMHGDFIVK